MIEIFNKNWLGILSQVSLFVEKDLESQLCPSHQVHGRAEIEKLF